MTDYFGQFCLLVVTFLVLAYAGIIALPHWFNICNQFRLHQFDILNWVCAWFHAVSSNLLLLFITGCFFLGTVYLLSVCLYLDRHVLCLSGKIFSYDFVKNMFCILPGISSPSSVFIIPTFEFSLMSQIQWMIWVLLFRFKILFDWAIHFSTLFLRLEVLSFMYFKLMRLMSYILDFSFFILFHSLFFLFFICLLSYRFMPWIIFIILLTCFFISSLKHVTIAALKSLNVFIIAFLMSLWLLEGTYFLRSLCSSFGNGI